jgi:hypothetical protein
VAAWSAFVTFQTLTSLTVLRRILTSESCSLCNFNISTSILFTTSILPEAALHAYFRNSSAIQLRLKITLGLRRWSRSQVAP